MSTLLMKEAVIPPEIYGARVDFALAQLFPEFSRSQLTLWLKQGAITVNQRQYKPKDKVYGGELVFLQFEPIENKHSADVAEEIPLEIVFEDEHLLIVNKPAGLVVHPGAGNSKHTLVNALLHHYSSLHHLPRAGIIHRLDKDTTGLLIVAKTLESHTALIRKMQAREIERHYLTLVYGRVIAGKRIESNYGRHPRNRLKMAVCQQGKEAITDFGVKTRYEHFTLLEVKLLTGRTHQIRVHMAHINHPVVGDQLYGGRIRFPSGASGEIRGLLQDFKRQALHAYYISLEHPIHDEILTLTAPLPDDFQFLLNQIESHV